MEMQLTGTQIATVAAELLTDSGLIEQETLEEAFNVAGCMKLPLGRILVSTGHIADSDWSSALKAAKLFLNDQVSRAHALRALRQAYVECLPLEVIMERHAMGQSKVGELLLCAGVVIKNEIEKFSEQARESGLTLGRILVLTNTLNQCELTNTIDALILVRDRVITFEQAALALQLTWTGELSLDQALFELCGTHPRPKCRLGELLVKAGLITEIDAVNALEISLEHEKQLGQVLFESGLLPPLMLKSALRLQSLLANSTVTDIQAAELLRQVHRLQMPVDSVLMGLSELKRQTVELLIGANIVSDRDIRKAVQMHPAYREDAAGALLASGTIDIALLKCAVRCLTLTQKRQISFDEAIKVLKRCKLSSITVEEALKQLVSEKPVEFSAAPHAFPMPLHAVTLTA